MGVLKEPVATRSHNAWKNLATRYGRFCVQKRTEEGLLKNTKLRHRFLYVAEDLVPFRIIYSTHANDFNDALPAASPVGNVGPLPRMLPVDGITSGDVSSKTGLSTASTATPNSTGMRTSTSALGSASASSGDDKEGFVSSLLHWLTGSEEINNNTGYGGRAGQRDGSDAICTTAAAAAAPTANFLSFLSPFSEANTAMERFTVATSTQLSDILEAWGLLLAAWEPEEAELNVLSFASPAMGSPRTRQYPMASPTTTGSHRQTSQVAAAAAATIMPAAAARVPFDERWRRTYGRIEVLCAESGMERSMRRRSPDNEEEYNTAMTSPPSPSLNDSGMNFSTSDMSPLVSTVPASRVRRAEGLHGEETSLDLGASMRSFAGRRHVHVSDAYYSADGSTPIVVAHFFDVLLIRVVDLLMWRDPQLTACCLGILVSVYGYSAWASALCYLAGPTLTSSSQYCSDLYAHAAGASATMDAAAGRGWLFAERVWWGAPLFMTGVLAYPWTREQQRRIVTATDREHLRSIDYALQWLCACDEEDETPAAPSSVSSAAAMLMDVARRVCVVLRVYRLPISVLFVFNLIGAFSTWEAILVLLLWPMLIVSVALAGAVVATQCFTNH